MDPEQVYAEVLSEEQQKGSSPAVAEGRAKAARARAEAGSPSPKEPKWWPGSQPHLEGGEAPGAEEAAEEPVAAEPEAVEAPAPAAPAPAAAPVEAPAPAPSQAPAAPVAPAAEQPAAATVAAPAEPAPTPVSATAPVPVGVAAAPQTSSAAPETATAPAPLPSGVSAGTTTGTRLRPEDESATDAQFAGQQAMYERRKLIDDLVSTGVPAVTASEGGRPRGGALLVFMYLLIPIAAIAILAAVNKGGTEAPGGGSGSPAAPSGPTLVAQNVQFTTSSLSLPADKPVTLHFDNKDSTPHNVGIYDKQGGKELFKGSVITGPSATDYKVDALKAGTYYFQCDLHPDSMNGSVTVK